MPVLATPSYKVTPSSTKTQLQTNYVSLFDYSHEKLPEIHDEIAQIYGNQSVSGLLHVLGSESGFASDQYIWTEEGRLHTIYKDVTRNGNVFTKAGHVFRLNETVHVSDGTTKRRGIVTAVTDDTFTLAAYKAAGFAAMGTTGITAFVDGSEYKKGTKGMQGSLDSSYTKLSNKPIILKDRFEVNGSEATQIGWIKTEEGGYLWYLQSELDTRRRWEDRLELAMVLGQLAENGSDAYNAGYLGTEGLFEAVETRGNLFQGLADDITDWDDIVKRFDAQGKISDYMFYNDRSQSLAIDNMLGQLNAGHAAGVSYGIFNNDKDMSVNLGFKGFTRGTYNFFKTDYKLLNDPTLLGAVEEAAGRVHGILVPQGTKEVYEGDYNGRTDGAKMTVPFLEMKYRVAGNENRKYKTWVTGTVGGVYTDDEDVMKVNHLSERLLATVGANNFMLFTGN